MPYDIVRETVAWLDERNGTGKAEMAARILKVAEEVGEASAAWVGATGQNPRKGRTHTWEDIARELGDVAFTAMVAIESLGYSSAVMMEVVASKVRDRIGESPK